MPADPIVAAAQADHYRRPLIKRLTKAKRAALLRPAEPAGPGEGQTVPADALGHLHDALCREGVVARRQGNAMLYFYLAGHRDAALRAAQKARRQLTTAVREKGAADA